MHRIILMLLVILLPAISITSQDYQMVRSGSIAYFSDSNEGILTLKVDSFSLEENDSILYPAPSILKYNDNCLSPNRGSWIGRQIRILPEGENIFYNRVFRRVSIQTRAGIGETWIAYTVPNSISIEATVIQHDTLSFLGLTDSVKTISFQAYDKNGDSLDLVANQYYIRLSKHYGLVTTLNFFLFPDYSGYYSMESLTECDLIGLTEPRIGYQNLTWLDVHDFQPGDELHVLHEESSWEGENDGYAKTIKRITRYLERDDSPDSVRYRIFYRESRLTVNDGTSYTFSYDEDTVWMTVSPDTTFDMSLPGVAQEDEVGAFAYRATKDYPRTKTKPSVYRNIFYYGDSCWGDCCVDGCAPSYEYLEGLGGPYYDCTHVFSMGGIDHKLVYYKKGDTTSGTPLIITSLPEKIFAEEITVYPNPANQVCYVKLPGGIPGSCTFELLDVSGRLVFRESLGSSDTSFDISQLKPGVYLYRISLRDSFVKSGKLTVI